MIAVVIRCQSYPGTYQFAAARLSGRESIREGLTALPAWAGGAHSQFEHMGCGPRRTIFGYRVVSHVRSGTGAGVRGALENRLTLPVVPLRIQFVPALRASGSSIHRALQVLQDALRDVSKKFRPSSCVVAHDEHRTTGAADACAEKLSLRVRK